MRLTSVAEDKLPVPSNNPKKGTVHDIGSGQKRRVGPIITLNICSYYM